MILSVSFNGIFNLTTSRFDYRVKALPFLRFVGSEPLVFKDSREKVETATVSGIRPVGSVR